MRFPTIVADAPWRYGAGFRLTGGVNHHYRTMTTREIAALPVADVAADDCALFLWAPCPMVPDALRVMDTWGFRFVTVAFVWVKLNPRGAGFWSGLGHWTNLNVELVLMGRRGTPTRLRRDVKQLVLARRGRHSEKPESVQDRIERLVPGPYLELFARRTCLGDELDGLDIREALARLRELPDAAGGSTPTWPLRATNQLPLFEAAGRVA